MVSNTEVECLFRQYIKQLDSSGKIKELHKRYVTPILLLGLMDLGFS